MGKKIEFTEEQKKEIVNLYRKEFENPKEIGKKFDCDTDVIRRILREEKVYMYNSERRKILIRKGKFNPTSNFGKYREKGNIPHNKGKTKDNYEPLKKQGETTKGRKVPWVLKRNLENNPMNNLKIRKKSSKTKKNKFKDKNYLEKYLKTNKGIFKEGEEHPFFNNWSSFEPYTKEFNDNFRRFIRKRDNYICMLCGVHREKLNRTLEVHHINYDKKTSIQQNCISLCHHCHSKTNFNRKHWTKFFQSLLSERYDYQYSETGEIILETKQ